MPRYSETIVTPEGIAIVCGSRPGPRKCRVCGRPSTKLCDYPVKPPPSKARCNAPACDDHSVHVGEDLDWCYPCAELDAKAAVA